MIVISANSVNQALAKGLRQFFVQTEPKELSTTPAVHVENSRNGPVYRLHSPVTTVYTAPFNRVLVSELRNANPFFHLFEAIWMLAGANDVEFVGSMVKQMRQYTDDGVTLNGAYGHRWRHHFGCDQLLEVIALLNDQRNTRRAVLAMWDGARDIVDARRSADVPCNTTIYFSVQGGFLDMTVCCRSNDALWGAYGANAVHMSFLHEFVAGAVGLHLGRYFQVSNDLHIYKDVISKYDDVFEVVKQLEFNRCAPDRLYVTPMNWGEFLDDCEIFAENQREVLEEEAYSTRYFLDVVLPMARLYHFNEMPKNMATSPWLRDGVRWMKQNRKEKFNVA